MIKDLMTSQGPIMIVIGLVVGVLWKTQRALMGKVISAGRELIDLLDALLDAVELKEGEKKPKIDADEIVRIKKEFKEFIEKAKLIKG